MNFDEMTEFILQDQRHFSIASAVFDAWPRCRERIALGFFQRLADSLRENLPGWQTTIGQDYYEAPWAAFRVTKPSWSNAYEIPLQFVKLGRSIQFGVARSPQNTRPFDSRLQEAVMKLHPTSRAAPPSWEALVIMRSPASDWRTPDVLWRMHSDPLFLCDVSEQLQEVARAAEPILDETTEGMPQTSAPVTANQSAP